MLSSFDAFEKYIAMKLHFNDPKYDYFKYNGKTSVSRSSFNGRRDSYSFDKASRKYGESLIIPFYVANFVKDVNFWIGDDEADNNFREWKARVDSINRTIQEDLVAVREFMDSKDLTFDKLYDIQEEGKFPALFRMHLSQLIQPETAMLLMNGLKLFDRWEGKPITEQATYRVECLKLQRYAGFFNLPQLMEKNQSAIAELFKPRTG